MFYKGEIPFVRLLIPLIIGIIAGVIVRNPLILKWGLILSFSLLGILLLLIIYYKRLSLYKKRWFMGVLVHLYVFLAGYFLTVNIGQRYDSQYFTNTSSEALIVKVSNEPKLSGNILRFESQVTHNLINNSVKPVTGKLLIALKTDSLSPLQLNYGDVLLIPSHYNEIEPPYNPGEFDFKAWLEAHQIYQQSFINHQQLVILKHQDGDAIISFALALRKQLVNKFYTYLPDKEAAALASTLILGYRADLSKEVISAYSKTGTMHVLSVSGMHVGIVFLVLNLLLKPLNKNSSLRLVRAVLIISVIWFYSLITGFSPSVCRSAMMLTFIVLGKALNKSQNTYNLLAISAFFLLLYNPFYLLDVGFQLSYLAVIGLVYFHPKIYQTIYIRNKMLDSIWSYTALSIAAQLATFPISIYYFHQFPLYFLFSNLFIVLPVAVIMYAGILFLFVPWMLILKPLGWLLNALINFTNNILYYIEHLPWSNLAGIWIDTSQYLLIYLMMGCVIWAIASKKKLAFMAILTAVFLFAASIASQSITNYNRHELIFFSLRKNFAIANIQKGRNVVISDLKFSDKTMLFSVKPALDKFGTANDSNYKLKNQLYTTADSVHSNFMQFANFKIIRWDKKLDHLSFAKRLKVNAILLSGNPKITLDNLKQYADFSLLLIDGTNSDYHINLWQQEAEKLNLNYHILKKNKAFIVKL